MSANIKTNHKKYSVLFGIVFLLCFYFKKLPVSIKPHACFLVLTLDTLNSLSSQLPTPASLELNLNMILTLLSSVLDLVSARPNISNWSWPYLLVLQIRSLSELSSLRIKSCPDLHFTSNLVSDYTEF